MRKINVDIHYDFAKAVMVVAKDKDEAIRIVEEKLRKGEIDPEHLSQPAIMNWKPIGNQKKMM